MSISIEFLMSLGSNILLYYMYVMQYYQKFFYIFISPSSDTPVSVGRCGGPGICPAEFRVTGYRVS